MLDYRTETFLVLCETMNYTHAAQRLHITQPAVTQHIKHLEMQYGCQLFTYQGKTLSLTPKGKRLHEMARCMQANDRRITREMAIPSLKHTPLHVGATKTIGEFILPPVVTGFLTRYPETDFSLTVDNTQRLLHLLSRGSIDLAVVEGVFDQADYDGEVYRRAPFIGVCSPTYPGAQQEWGLSDLLGETLIVREPGSGTRFVLEQELESHCLSIGSFHHTIQASNFNMIKQLAIEGLGITFLYEPAVRKELSAGMLRRLRIHDFHVVRPFHFVRMKDDLFSERANQFSDYCRACTEL